MIFIHSLFRSGSTYLFNVFRRSSGGYWCYQEPLHEISFAAKDDYKLLLSVQERQAKLFRHPRLEKPYFFELYEVAEKSLPKLTQKAIYEDYFATDIASDFWLSLIDEAKGRPVIQECRTSSRIKAIKSTVGGYHIYLWRNPWDQWWSYKINNYFYAANQMIINAQVHPKIISNLRREIDFIPCPKSDIFFCFEWFKNRKLSPEYSYLVFYILWFLGLKEGQENADVLLNIDYLTNNLAYRQKILSELINNGIDLIDFSDCSIPQAFYTEKDTNFFSKIEDKAHGLLLLSGFSQSALEQIIKTRLSYAPQTKNNQVAKLNVARDAERARNLVLEAERNESKQLTEIQKLEDDLERVNVAQSVAMEKLIDIQNANAKIQNALSEKNEILVKTEQHNQWLQEKWDNVLSKLEEKAVEIAEKDVLLEEKAVQIAEKDVLLEEKAVQIAEKNTLLDVQQGQLIRQKNHNEWVESEWDKSETKIEVLSVQIGEKDTLLVVSQDELARQKKHSQWLQTEWDAAKKQLEDLYRRIDEKNHIYESELLRQKEHSQWLQNEWDASKKNADNLSKELDYMSHSKSWVLTTPFRLLLKGGKWFLKKTLSLLYISFVAMPKRISGKLVLQLRHLLNDKPAIKFFIIRILKPFPQAKNKLMSIGMARKNVPNDIVVQVIQSATLEYEDVPQLSLRANQIYTKLHQSIQKNFNQVK